MPFSILPNDPGTSWEGAGTEKGARVNGHALNGISTKSQTDNIPIVVVGLSFKLPQGIESVDAFWEALKEARSAWSSYPASRLNFEGIYDPDEERVNGFPLKGAHFVDGDVAAFDAPFFTISPAEAAEIDPQSRILLETTYKALENAGIPMERIANSRTSVHTGSFGDDYKGFHIKDPLFGGPYSASSVSASMLANRISWFFNLRGESINMDTACSSTLVAFHTACQGLRSGDADTAIVAGANLILGPDTAMSLNNQGFLSPDGRCWSFDEKANGYGRGEGFAALILKRLDDALASNSSIRAVIRATGTNQDGRTPGIVQPSQVAQAELIRETYCKAGLDMSLTRYVEAHGTGTPVGDPIEAGAISDAFADVITPERPLYVGSVKSNIGHLEGTSGMAALIKSILMLEQGMIPAIAGLEHVNSSISERYPCLKFPSTLCPWPSKGLRRVSINSFGFGGTNAHVIMEDAENHLRLAGYARRSPNPSFASTDGSKLLVFSARDEKGINRIQAVYNDHLARIKEDRTGYLDSLSYTLTQRRSSFLWRAFTVCRGEHALRGGIKLTRPVKALSTARLALCFTGQGAQWYAMGRELNECDLYTQSIAQSAAVLKSLGCAWNLKEELSREKEESRVNEPEFSQTLCTAVQIALVDVLEAVGTQPTVVFGHSSGEIAAAYAIGGLDRNSAIRAAYYRGYLSSRLAANHKESAGRMLSVAVAETDILPYFEAVKARFGKLDITVGCVNSPSNVTITGNALQIDYLKELCHDNRVFARKLAVTVAYHSSRMEAIAREYAKLLGSFSPRKHTAWSSAKMLSSVTGEMVSRRQVAQAEYWVKNMVSPVRFVEALSGAALPRHDGQFVPDKTKLQFEDVLEIGPHSALQRPVKDTLKSLSKGSEVGYVSALVRGVDAVESLFNAFGYLHCRGHVVSLQAINQLTSSGNTPTTPPLLLTDLPEYPFDHSLSYWRESRLSKGHRLREAPRNDFLGTRVPDWNPWEAKWRRRIKLSEDPWLEDHKIASVNILPGAAMLVMAVEASKSVAKSRFKDRVISGYTIKDVSFTRALAISPDIDGTEVEFYLKSGNESDDGNSRRGAWSEFRLFCIDNEVWVKVCQGHIQISFVEESGAVDQGLEAQLESKLHSEELERLRSTCYRPVEMQNVYAAMAERGLDFGPAHQVIKSCSYTDEFEVVADMNPNQWRIKSRRYHQTENITVHPTFLDGLFQMNLVAMTEGGRNVAPSVVVGIRKIWIAESSFSSTKCDSIAVPAWSKSAHLGHGNTTSDVVCLDPLGQTSIIVIDGLQGRFLKENGQAETAKRMLWNFDYRPDIELLNHEDLLKQVTSTFTLQPSPFDLDRDIKLLLYLCILRTLKQLTSEDAKNLAPHHQKYFAWMQREKEKLYAGECIITPVPDFRPYIDNDEFYNNLLDRIESENKRGKFFATLARNLYAILKKEQDALELMFQTPLAKDYYRELYKATNGLSKALSFIDLYAHKHPDMKVLEIGAGTGGMTKYVLETLTQNGSGVANVGNPRFSHYTYTDISAGFFSDAASLFDNIPNRVTFSVLDIEKDPSSQGFTEGTFDLVIADNVLHATQSLDTTVMHVRKLLKQGGKLVLFELTDPEVVRTNFAFGLLPGWWRANDTYRSFSAGVADSVWDSVLKKYGFSGIDLNLTDYDDPVCHEHSALISTAVSSDVKSNSNTLPRTLIIFDNACVLQAQVAQGLMAKFKNSRATDVVSLSLEVAAQKSDLNQWFCVILLELRDPFLATMNHDQWRNIQAVLKSDGGLLWVCRGGGVRPTLPEHALIQGMLRGLRQEERHAKFISLSMEPTTNDTAHLVDRIGAVLETITQIPVHKCEQEYVERDGQICVDRIVEADYLKQELERSIQGTKSSESTFGAHNSLSLSIETPGLLDTLEFMEGDDTIKQDLAPDDIEILIEVSGVNFRDCLIALGRLAGSEFGFECAGRVSRKGNEVVDLQIGDRVCASAVGTYQTYTRCKAADAILIPASMSFVEAASIPVVFTTAFYALVHVARIRKEESILIHSAGGGTGQAAIQIAQLVGAEIFATVGSEEKKSLLMGSYGIPADHIFDSRNSSFAKGIRRMTIDRGGVDVVLNSLSGDLLLDSWHCVAPFGRFLELGKKDILANRNLPMQPFARNASFHAIDLAEARRHQPSLLQKLRDDIKELLARGAISPPQPLHVYGIGEVEKAFRYLQSGKNTGKAVVELRRDDVVKTRLRVQHKWRFDPKSTYVIAGGLGGIGRRTAWWMVTRGAKNLVLLSRSGDGHPEVKKLVDDIRQLGARVETPLCDISDYDALKQTLETISISMPPVKGCIQSAMVLRNKVFGNMTFKDWRDCFECKVPGSWNLHRLLPKGMDFFIMYSSLAGGLGGTASVNYSAACVYQDALAHYRNSVGEKATTFNLGVMVDDGVLRDNVILRATLVSTGFLLGISQREMFALLDHYCDPSLEIPDTPLKSQVVVGVDVPHNIKNRGIEIPGFMHRPLFKGMWNIADRNSAPNQEGDPSMHVVQELASIKSRDEAAEVIANALMVRLSKALGVPLGNLEISQSIHSYGVDSLVAVELRNWFKSKLQADVAVFEMLGNSTSEDIGRLVAAKSQLVANLLA